MDHILSPEQLRAVIEALEKKSKVQAVKVYREATGLSLAECIKAVEAIPHTPAPSTIRPEPVREPLSPREPAPTGLTPEKRAAVLDAMRRRQKIEAIKIYREATGLGLAESKEAVEAMEASGVTRGGGSTFEGRTPLPHWDPLAEKKKGCLGMIVMLAGVAAGVGMIVW